MSDDARVQQLVEQILDSQSTPEDVCGSCPDLLPQVRAAFQRLRALQAEIAVLFPPQTAAIDAPVRIPSSETPSIPGYEVFDVLGRGGTSVVYKATHVALKRTVAVKMIAAGYPHSAERARFRAEAEAVARLQHSNFVQIHEIGDLDGRPFLALEYVAGGSLAKRLAKEPVPQLEAARLVAILAEAMHFAHSRNFVHRDLKPSNVLLEGEIDVPLGRCQPKVTDFGLVRQMNVDSGHTFDGMVMGTPSYMAPEQAEGLARAAGPAADVYALGAILYECLTGRPPFQGPTAKDILEQVRHREPVPPSSLNRSVPRDLETICLKCLRKEPDRRYSSARELAEDLGRFMDTRPIFARPVGFLERTEKWVRRRPAEAGLIAAAVLLLLGSTAGGVWYIVDRDQRHLEEALRNTELRNRSEQMNGQVALALDDADKHLLNVRSALQDPCKTAVWRSEPDLWQAQLEGARQAVQRARSAVLAQQAVLDRSMEARLQATQTTLTDEERHFAEAKELDDLMLSAIEPVKGRERPDAILPRYAEFFANHGIDIARDDADQSASAIMRSPIRFVLVAALDHWSECTMYSDAENPDLLRKLLRIARTADPDPWRDRFRDEAVWRDPDLLLQLASQVDADRQPSGVLAALGAILEARKGNPTSFYKKALFAHPRDFWLHLNAAFNEANGEESVALHLAALAVRPNSSLAYHSLGYVLYNQDDCKGAEIACRKAIDLNPNYIEAHYLLGQVRTQLHDLPGAIAAFARCIDLDPKDADAYLALGASYRNVPDLPAAVVAYKKAIELEPKRALHYVWLGRVLYSQKNFPEAVRAYKKAIELDPKDGQAQVDLGLALHDQRNTAGAISAYRKAIALDPKQASFYRQLGHAYLEQDKSTEAVTAYKKAIQLDPKDAEAYSQLGRALTQLDDVSGALAVHEKAIELRPLYAKGHYELGYTLIEKKEFGGAVGAFKKAIELDPKYADAYYELGFALEEQKDHVAAIAAYDKAIDLGFKDVIAYNNLGVALRGNKQFDQAIVAHRRAIELDPREPLSHSGLGIALRGAKRFDEALLAFKKSIDLDPKVAYAYNGLGKTLVEMKRWNDGVVAYTKAIKLNSKDATAYDNFAWILSTCPDVKVRSGKRAIEYATKACKLSDWKTGRFLATLAAAYAEAGDFERAVRYQTDALNDPAYEAEFGEGGRPKLELYKNMKPFRLPQ